MSEVKVAPLMYGKRTIALAEFRKRVSSGVESVTIQRGNAGGWLMTVNTHDDQALLFVGNRSLMDDLMDIWESEADE